MSGDPCPKCGSKTILSGGELKAVADPGALQVVFFKRPNQVFFPGPVRADVQVRVCGECGYAEMYVQNPKELVKAFSE